MKYLDQENRCIYIPQAMLVIDLHHYLLYRLQIFDLQNFLISKKNIFLSWSISGDYSRTKYNVENSLDHVVLGNTHLYTAIIDYDKKN